MTIFIEKKEARKFDLTTWFILTRLSKFGKFSCLKTHKLCDITLYLVKPETFRGYQNYAKMLYFYLNVLAYNSPIL